VNFELKILITLIFLVYLIYFSVSKNYIKTFMPFMFMGYLIGPFGWNLIDTSVKEIIYLFIAFSLFILGMQMGRGLNQKFWKQFPVELFFQNVIEKMILMSVFLLFFFLVIPSFQTVHLPLSFPFYVSIGAFSFSFLFFKFVAPTMRKQFFSYYEINNLIIMSLFIIFQFFVNPSKNDLVYYPVSIKLLSIFIIGLMLLILLKLKMKNTKMIHIFLLSLIFISAGLSDVLGFSPMLLGFGVGLVSNYMTVEKQIQMKRFLFLFNDYIMILFVFFIGIFMEISVPILLLGIVYIAIRLTARFFLNLFSFKDFKKQFQKDLIFLFQGEYFLGFLIIYAIDYKFNAILSIAVVSLFFTEILINYYYSKLNKNKEPL